MRNQINTTSPIISSMGDSLLRDLIQVIINMFAFSALESFNVSLEYYGWTLSFRYAHQPPTIVPERHSLPTIKFVSSPGIMTHVPSYSGLIPPSS